MTLPDVYGDEPEQEPEAREPEVSKRSREDITSDIVNGFITEDFAKTHYGY